MFGLKGEGDFAFPFIFLIECNKHPRWLNLYKCFRIFPIVIAAISSNMVFWVT